MTDLDILPAWVQRFSEPTTGWSFDAFEASVSSQGPPWSDTDLTRRLMLGSRSALDLGTGGGEQLLGLADVWPRDTHATEGWEPNVTLERYAAQLMDLERRAAPLVFREPRFSWSLDGTPPGRPRGDDGGLT